MCTSGENNSPESLLKAVLDSQGVTGVAREPIDYYVIDVSFIILSFLWRHLELRIKLT